jgi:lambda family phage tail tape measure protein
MATNDAVAKLTLSAVDKTKVAFESVKRNLTGIDGAADAVGAKFGSLGTLVAGAFAGVSFAAVTNLLDDLDDLSEKTGISVEKLSGLRYAAETNSVSFETLGDGVRKFNKNLADAAGGSKEAIARFDALGISLERIKTASNDEILLDIADKFQTYAAGANKSALAAELFGKTAGPDLIPLLNQGRAGIAALTEEGKKLGVVYDKDLAKAAADLNDNLRKLKFAAEGAAAVIGGPLIRNLSDMARQLVESTVELGRFAGLFESVRAGFQRLLKQDELGNLVAEKEEQGKRIAQLGENIAKYEKAQDTAVGRFVFGGMLEKAREEMTALQKQSVATGEAIQAVTQRIMFEGRSPTIDRGIAGAAPVVDRSTNATKTISEYDKLIKRIKDRQAAELEELEVGRELTAAEKFRVDITNQLEEALSKLSPKAREQLEAARDYVVALIEQNDFTKEQKKNLEEQAKLVAQQTQDLARQNETQREHNQALAEANEEIGLTVEAIEELHLARLRVALATAEQAAAEAALTANSAAQIGLARQKVELLKDEVALRESASAKAKAQSEDVIFGFSKAIDAYVREAAKVGEAVEGLTIGTLKGLEDELTSLLAGQKTNFRGLVDALIAEVIRLKIVKPLLTEIFGGGTSGGGIFSALAGLAGSAVSVATGSYNPNYSNEGRAYMTPSSAGMYSPSITVNVDSRADQGYVASAAAQGVAEGNKQMIQLLRTRGVL